MNTIANQDLKKTRAQDQIQSQAHSPSCERRPELLCPAGSPEAMKAAIAAGADAVYFGVDSFNARANARNFSADELSFAVAMLHAHGVGAHLTLNVQVYDRELDDALRCAEAAYKAGVDALIVSDFGLARLLRRNFPDIELHASTQASGHSVRDAEYFAKVGFSRMVCARELSRGDIKTLVERSPIGIEMFIHGAICVSVSGQCLFSSIVGGRSGNRGECAQPCRLPYDGKYPLSPKDMCLAGHMADIVRLGVCSLKIEGRMKSPEYVFRTASLYRRLIDERRDADESEIRSLARVFSRSGFTDAYYTSRVSSDPNAMIGIRTDADKDATRSTSGSFAVPEIGKVPIERIYARFRLGEPSMLTITSGGRSAVVYGATPEPARTSPLTEDSVKMQLNRFGATEYAVTDKTAIEIDLGKCVGSDPVSLPLSAVNELRRRAVDALTGVRERVPARVISPAIDDVQATNAPLRGERPLLTAEFLRAEQVTDRARQFFDRIYLPLHEYDSIAGGNDDGNDGRDDDGDDDDYGSTRRIGFSLPPVVTDSEQPRVSELIRRAVKFGAGSCLICGPGQFALVRELGIEVAAGHRFNVCNSYSALSAIDLGADFAIVSPETSLAQIRGIARRAPIGVIVYGRLPLMVTRRCIIRAVDGKSLCADCGRVHSQLRDRRGVRFPMYGTRRDGACGTVIYNSVPIYMADKKDELSRLHCRAWHFRFTDEDAGEVDIIIDKYMRGEPPRGEMKRIK